MTPYFSLALAVGLITICWAIALLQRERDHRARTLIGMVGLAAVLHGLRMLTESGVLRLGEIRQYDGIVDVIVATLCLIALMILHNEFTRHHAAEVRLRLSQAMKAPSPGIGAKATKSLPDQGETGREEQEDVELCLRRLIKDNPAPIVVFNQDGCVCASNAAADRLFGQEHGLKLGKPLPALPAGPGDKRDDSLRNLNRKTLDTGQKRPSPAMRDSRICQT